MNTTREISKTREEFLWHDVLQKTQNYHSSFLQMENHKEMLWFLRERRPFENFFTSFFLNVFGVSLLSSMLLPQWKNFSTRACYLFAAVRGDSGFPISKHFQRFLYIKEDIVFTLLFTQQIQEQGFLQFWLCEKVNHWLISLKIYVSVGNAIRKTKLL